MTVFANGLEVSAKKQSCQVIAAFPDTCFTPPQTPATPPGVPLPYPNFGKDGDLSSGTGTVKIKDEEISQENSSNYSKCTGDEAGSAPKKGLLTSKNTGKVYAQKWSMDVKAEGKGVARFSDIATTNHASNIGNALMMILTAAAGVFTTDDEYCIVGSYRNTVSDCNAAGGQAHHIVPDDYLRSTNRSTAESAARSVRQARQRLANGDAVTAAELSDTSRLNENFPTLEDGCCVCVGGNERGQTSSEHNARQSTIDRGEDSTFNSQRGHGFLHETFDGGFGQQGRSVESVVLHACYCLLETALYDQSRLSMQCALEAMACVIDSFEDALNADPPIQIQPTALSGNADRMTRLDPGDLVSRLIGMQRSFF